MGESREDMVNCHPFTNRFLKVSQSTCCNELDNLLQELRVVKHIRAAIHTTPRAPVPRCCPDLPSLTDASRFSPARSSHSRCNPTAWATEPTALECLHLPVPNLNVTGIFKPECAPTTRVGLINFGASDA